MFKVWILILFIMLFVCSISDIKTGYINTIVILIALFTAIAIAFETLIMSDLDIKYLMFQGIGGIIPGIFILAVSKLKFGIGEGDAYVIITAGFMSGMWMTVSALFIAFIFSGLYGIIMINLKDSNNDDDSFPFVPFITMGYMICICFAVMRKKVVWL